MEARAREDEALPAALAARFDAWVEACWARHHPPLERSDLRKGIRSLSSLYVERRGGGAIGARATGGAARRAAFAAYYAPLHFLVAFHAAGEAGLTGSSPRRILDLGCGTGAAGAAVACAAAGAPRLLGIDCSGWVLREARHTYAAFGLAARTRRGALPAALPALRPGDLAVLGWVVNELASEERERLVDALVAGASRGARLLWLEPLAGGPSPWWDDVAGRLAESGVEAASFRRRASLPEWLAGLDRAAGLDHAELGARVLRSRP